MKASIYKVLSLTAIFSSLLTSSLVAQVTSSRSSNETSTAEVAKAQDAVKRILDESGSAFREGLAAYLGDNRAAAGERFDRSIEVFLLSTLNIQREAKLQNCYNQLVETIYRIEFPADHQLPQVRSLAITCGWVIDNAMSDTIALKAKAVNAKPMGPILPNTLASNSTPDNRGPQVGFASQEFEPSPLDELSKLELTQEEKQIDTNPVAQQQYQYIQQAVANKSLGFSFQVHPMIQQFINYYRGRGQKTMETGLYRSGMFMRMARVIFKDEGLPENVAWLGQVESAWKPVAMSHMAASGLWQFIPGTGDRYGLKRNAYVDERNSLDEATRASARYLKFLFNRYGNWELAMAGYNCGEGNVDKAIRRAGVKNFWAAYPYLPKETRDYVPNILAVILVANNPGEYGFGHVRPAAPLQYDRIRVPASTNLHVVAQAADVNVQYIRYLNPHFRSNMTPPEPYIVNVPRGKGDEVVALFRRMPATKLNNSNIANSAAGETWQNLANRTGVSVAELMAANPGMAVPKGRVFYPVKGNNVASTVDSRATNRPVSKAPAVNTVKAGFRDTISTIATRLNISPKELAQFNDLKVESPLHTGRELRVPPSSNK